jgi:proteic killer suppression protein
MIVDFADWVTAEFYRTGKTKEGWQSVASIAKNKLDQLNGAAFLEDLAIPPGNRLELLSGDRRGQHSIRISRKWRICFRWTDHGPSEDEITNNHK